MSNDIIYNKVETIQRCVNRIIEVYDGNEENLEDYTKQDSIILNLQRACEASIDLAMHIISAGHLGIPQNSRDAFEIIYKNGIISEDTMNNLKKMVGFRNIAVHNYQAIQTIIIKGIIENNLEDFHLYGREIIRMIK